MLKHIKKRMLSSIPKSYIPVSLDLEKSRPQIFLYDDASELSIDVTDRHNVLCMKPFSYGIWLKEAELPGGGPYSLYLRYTPKNVEIGNARLSLIGQYSFGQNYLVIFQVRNSTIHILPGWKIKVDYRIQNMFADRPLTRALHADLLFAYSCPRSVSLMSVGAELDRFLFPMDFRLVEPDSGLIAIGLSKGNKSVRELEEKGRIVNVEMSAADRNVLYHLGSRYQYKVNEHEELPFQLEESEVYKMWIPSGAASYREMEVCESQQLGSHVLFICKTIYQKVNGPVSPLYHIHGRAHHDYGGYLGVRSLEG